MTCRSDGVGTASCHRIVASTHRRVDKAGSAVVLAAAAAAAAWDSVLPDELGDGQEGLLQAQPLQRAARLDLPRPVPQAGQLQVPGHLRRTRRTWTTVYQKVLWKKNVLFFIIS